MLKKKVITIKIKLIFDAQFIGKVEHTVEVPDDISDNQIKSLFFKELGIQFDDNCYWEKL